MPSKSDLTKLHIIEKAAPLFNRLGFAGTAMSDILAATGLTKGGIYGNFKSKDEIAAAAFEHSFQRMKATLTAAIIPQPTAVGRLLALLNFYHNYTLFPTIEGGCPVVNSAVEVRAGFPALQKQVNDALQDMLDALQRIVDLGIARGELRADLLPRQEAELIYAQITGGMVMSRAANDPRHLNRLLDSLKRYVQQELTV